MQAFIVSDNHERIREVERALAGVFPDFISLASIPGTADNSHLVTVAQTVESSDYIVVDCVGAVTTFIAWVLGVCFVTGSPTVAIIGPGERLHNTFAPIHEIITVLDSYGELRMVSVRLAEAMQQDVETLVSVAAEIHADYLQRLGR